MKGKFRCLLLFALLLSTTSAWAGQITGTVMGSDGLPVIGATVVVKGTSIGAVTDAIGTYSINVPDDATTLSFTFIGYKELDKEITGNVMDVTMGESEHALDEVVVTAMGITRNEKALGYAVQTVKADELTQGAGSTLATALQGKTTGVSIRPSSGMPGASSQITIRGVRSFSGNNTPLYVIDGMPVASTYDRNMSTGDGVTGTDVANRAVDIDPNDIESINILKGQAASALYGIRASNGVIVITTKSGKGLAKGKPFVTFSSNASFDVVNRLPETQSTYAQGSGGRYSPTSSSSWGPKIADLPNDPTYGGNTDNAYTKGGKREGYYYVPQRANAGLDPWAKPQSYNNIKDYFTTGVTWNNFVNVAQALDNSSYSISLGSSNQDGIVPSTGMDRYNAKLVAETKLGKEWKTGVSANYVNTSLSKMPSANDGIMAVVYPTPPSYDLAGIPQYYEGNPTKVNNYRGGPFPAAYWAQDNVEFTEKTDRFFGNAFIDYTTKLGTENQKLNAKYQIGTDAYVTNYQDLWGYGIKGSAGNGQVENYSISNMTFNSLLTVNYDWTISEDWQLNALLGNEVVNNKYHYLYAYGANFQFPGWNHINNAVAKDNNEEAIEDRTVGFFGSASLSYKNMVFLSATGRNDIVSSMPRDNRSFFYPSVSLGFILTELEPLHGNDILNFAKLRASFAEVGQAGDYRSNYYSVPSYGGGFYQFTPLMYPINGTSGFSPYLTVYDPNLKPQNTQSYEVGFEVALLNNLITLDYTYSRQNVKDQIFEVPIAGSTGAQELLTNAGNMHTNAHEITLGVNPVKTKNINWEFAFNWTKVDNYVDELAPGVESIMLGGFVTPQVRAGIGDKYPVIYGSGYARDAEGRILVNDQGQPMSGEPQVIGHVAPDFTLGFNTTLKIYNFTLAAVLDWKHGGQMYSGTNGLLDFYGISKFTEGREGSFVFDGYKADGTKNDIAITGADAWQSYFAAINGIDETSIYDNSFIKLREISLAYPVIKNTKLEVNVSVFARNILLWSELPNFDPEASQGNTNMVGAFERFSLPQTSSYGLGFTLKF